MALTIDEMVLQADTIAIGKLVDVNEGAVLRLTDVPDPDGRQLVVLSLEVSRLVKVMTTKVSFFSKSRTRGQSRSILTRSPYRNTR